eukprot:CAMPEP_0172811892 /NCGR_PEP_ID=MMETSP1075-20121228/9695_1 /TAXON_ID=2916 /ORGANISM="Ceratium fusus, Strain PA161109" /LENGTH=523 /DNA_ID=CAMNT_0013651369 /DNA_START=8 /DNA_END=1577 /DNA_ORIENTATION=+
MAAATWLGTSLARDTGVPSSLAPPPGLECEHSCAQHADEYIDDLAHQAAILFQQVQETHKAEATRARRAVLTHRLQVLERLGTAHARLLAETRNDDALTFSDVPVAPELFDESRLAVRPTWSLEEKTHMDKVNSLDCMVCVGSSGTNKAILASSSEDGTVVLYEQDWSEISHPTCMGSSDTKSGSNFGGNVVPRGDGSQAPVQFGILCSESGEPFHVARFLSMPGVEGGWVILAAGGMSSVALWTAEAAAKFAGADEYFPMAQAAPANDLATLAPSSFAAAVDCSVQIWDITLPTRPLRTLPHPEAVSVLRLPQPNLLLSLSCPSTSETVRKVSSSSDSNSDIYSGQTSVTVWDLRASRFACRFPAITQTPGGNRDVDSPTLMDAASCTGGPLLAVAAGSSFRAWELRHALRPLLDCERLPSSNDKAVTVTAMHLEPTNGKLVALGCRWGSDDSGVLLGNFNGALQFGDCPTSRVPLALCWTPAHSAKASDARLAVFDEDGWFFGFDVATNANLHDLAVARPG